MLNILKQLENIKGQLSQLQNIPAVEQDLLLEKIRELYLAVMTMNQQPQEQNREETFELEPDISEEPRKIEKTPVTDEQKKAAPPKARTPEATTIAERFQGDKTFMNERLAQQTGKEDLSTKLQSKPIEDISKAIGLNDKYKLVRELFNGNSEFYSQTIEKLNHASNFNEAFTYINTTFDWDREEEPVQFLLDLVRRKFITDKNG
jgi:hypothetical protein